MTTNNTTTTTTTSPQPGSLLAHIQATSPSMMTSRKQLLIIEQQDSSLEAWSLVSGFSKQTTQSWTTTTTTTLTTMTQPIPITATTKLPVADERGGKGKGGNGSTTTTGATTTTAATTTPPSSLFEPIEPPRLHLTSEELVERALRVVSSGSSTRKETDEDTTTITMEDNHGSSIMDGNGSSSSFSCSLDLPTSTNENLPIQSSNNNNANQKVIKKRRKQQNEFGVPQTSFYYEKDLQRKATTSLAAAAAATTNETTGHGSRYPLDSSCHTHNNTNNNNNIAVAAVRSNETTNPYGYEDPDEAVGRMHLSQQRQSQPRGFAARRRGSVTKFSLQAAAIVSRHPNTLDQPHLQPSENRAKIMASDHTPCTPIRQSSGRRFVRHAVNTNRDDSLQQQQQQQHQQERSHGRMNRNGWNNNNNNNTESDSPSKPSRQRSRRQVVEEKKTDSPTLNPEQSPIKTRQRRIGRRFGGLRKSRSNDSVHSDHSNQTSRNNSVSTSTSTSTSTPSSHRQRSFRKNKGPKRTGSMMQQLAESEPLAHVQQDVKSYPAEFISGHNNGNSDSACPDVAMPDATGEEPANIYGYENPDAHQESRPRTRHPAARRRGSVTKFSLEAAVAVHATSSPRKDNNRSPSPNNRNWQVLSAPPNARNSLGTSPKPTTPPPVRRPEPETSPEPLAAWKIREAYKTQPRPQSFASRKSPTSTVASNRSNSLRSLQSSSLGSQQSDSLSSLQEPSQTTLVLDPRSGQDSLRSIDDYDSSYRNIFTPPSRSSSSNHGSVRSFTSDYTESTLGPDMQSLCTISCKDSNQLPPPPPPAMLPPRTPTPRTQARKSLVMTPKAIPKSPTVTISPVGRDTIELSCQRDGRATLMPAWEMRELYKNSSPRRNSGSPNRSVVTETTTSSGAVGTSTGTSASSSSSNGKE